MASTPSELLLQDILNELQRPNGGGGVTGTLIGALQKLQSAVVNTAGGILNLANTAANSKVGLSQVTEGVTGLASKLPGLGGAVSLLTTAITAAVSITEKNVEVYRQISASGSNFGGSLTQLRTAAMNTYMTMDEFAGLMKRNSDTFSRMGGTADEGARAFVNMAASLQKSGAGDHLRALGYTSEEVNQGLANYIALTGGRTKEELKNTKDITAAATNYMEQLDALAQITGKSREQMQDEAKERAANQALQSYLLSLDEKERARANAALEEARQKGGKANEEYMISQMLGIAPITKASQQFAVLAPQAAEQSRYMVNAVKDSSKSVHDVYKMGATLGVKVSKDVERLGETTKNVMITQGGEMAGTLIGMAATQNKLKAQGIKTEEDAQKQLASVQKNQEDRRKSEAATWTKLQQQLQEVGNRILSFLLPAFTFLSEMVAKVTFYLIKFTEPLIGFAKTFISDTIGPFFKTIFKNIMNFDFSPLVNFFQKIKDAIMGIDWKSIFESAKYAFDQIWSYIKALWTTASEVFGPVISRAGEIFTQIGNELGPVFKDLGEIASLVFQRIGDLYKWAEGNLIPIFKSIFEVAKPIVSAIMESMLPFWDVFKSLIKAIKALLSGDFSTMGDMLWNAGKSFIEGIKVMWQGLLESVKKLFSPSTWFKKEETPAANPAMPTPTGGTPAKTPTTTPAPTTATPAPATPAAATPSPAPPGTPVPNKNPQEAKATAQERLNNVNEQLLSALQTMIDYHRRTLDAVKQLSGNKF